MNEAFFVEVITRLRHVRIWNRKIARYAERHNLRSRRRSLDIPGGLRRAKYGGVEFRVAVIIAWRRNVSGSSERNGIIALIFASQNKPFAG